MNKITRPLLISENSRNKGWAICLPICIEHGKYLKGLKHCIENTDLASYLHSVQ
uniref:Uncharacterized protein n=1 Tax=Arundo donax TaxID=35708 RepID=A0A0A9CN02_ARUDO